MPPHRGAPLGNKNALKHGFYSRDFPKTDLRDLEAVDIKGLLEEISLVRLQLRQLAAQAQKASTPAECLEVICAINRCLARLNRLVKTQALLTGQASTAYSEMIDRVLAGLEACLPDPERLDP